MVRLLESSSAGKVAGRWLRRQRIRYRARHGQFTPWLPSDIDHRRLLKEIAGFFGLPQSDVLRLYEEYRALHVERCYSERLGEIKTLNFEEALILFVIMARYDMPGPIVEIGSFYGSSTRRILDARERLGLKNQVICFDVEDNIKHFTRDEARLLLQDVTGSVTTEVLDRYKPGLVYLDAHPFHLLKSVISEMVAHPRPCILAIHDCSFGLCNPAIKAAKDEQHITSDMGLWERHVLAEIFQVTEPLSSKLDNCEISTHKLRIFGTTHGLAVVLPKAAEPRRVVAQ